MFWAGALGEGGQTRAPRASLVSWLLPGLAPPGSDHRGSSFSISSGKGVWTLQGGKRHWPRVAETEGQMPRARGPVDLRGGCQAGSEPNSAPPRPRPSTPGMPVDGNSDAFRLWQILNGTSFHGCIRNLYINNELQDFTKTRMKPGVVPGCEPCRKLYCLRGICQPNATPGPVCHCEAGWEGLHCDQPADGPCHGHK